METKQDEQPAQNTDSLRVFVIVTWNMMRKRFFCACCSSSNFSSSRSMLSFVGTTRFSSTAKSSRL